MLYSFDQSFFVLYNEIHNSMIRLFTEIIRHFEYAAPPSSNVEQQLKIILDKYNELTRQNKSIKSNFDKQGVEIRESWLTAKHANEQAKNASHPTTNSLSIPGLRQNDQKQISRSPKKTKLEAKLKDSSLSINKIRQSDTGDDGNQSGINELETERLGSGLKSVSEKQKVTSTSKHSVSKKESSANNPTRQSNLQQAILSPQTSHLDFPEFNYTSSQLNRESNVSNVPINNRSASHRLTDLQDREFRLLEDKFVKKTVRETNLSRQRSPEEQSRPSLASKERLSSAINDSKVPKKSLEQEQPSKISFAPEITNRPLAFSKATNGTGKESDLDRYLRVRNSTFSRDTKINIQHLNLPDPVREERESMFGETPNLDQIQSDLTSTQGQLVASNLKASETKAHLINLYKPNKVITLSQLKAFTVEFYTAKLEYDARNSDSKNAKETPEEFLLMYLKQKYGLNELVQAWAFAIVDGLKTYANSDVDIAILLHVD